MIEKFYARSRSELNKSNQECMLVCVSGFMNTINTSALLKEEKSVFFKLSIKLVRSEMQTTHMVTCRETDTLC